MSDNIVRTPVEENDDTIIKKQVMNKSDDNIIRHQVIGIGGAPSIEVIPLTATENKNYPAPEGKAYDPVIVNVPTPEPVLDTITITENGTFTPEAPAVGFYEAIVNISEPTSKVVSEFNFDTSEYDLSRSIIRTAPEVSSYIYGAPYNASVQSGEMVFNTTGQGYFHPAYYLNDFNNYEIEIAFGTVDNTQGGWELCGFKIYGQNYCVWLNYENNVLTAFNSSGNFNIPNRTLADFSNKTIKFLVTHKISPTTNDTLTEVSILFEGETTPIKLGDVDNKYPYYPFIGSLSGNAIRGISIKSIKITQSKWNNEEE